MLEADTGKRILETDAGSRRGLADSGREMQEREASYIYAPSRGRVLQREEHFNYA